MRYRLPQQLEQIVLILKAASPYGFKSTQISMTRNSLFSSNIFKKSIKVVSLWLHRSCTTHRHMGDLPRGIRIESLAIFMMCTTRLVSIWISVNNRSKQGRSWIVMYPIIVESHYAIKSRLITKCLLAWQCYNFFLRNIFMTLTLLYLGCKIKLYQHLRHFMIGCKFSIYVYIEKK